MSTTVVRRTTSCSQFGTWDVAPATEITNLNDESTSTYVSAQSSPSSTFINLDQNTYPDGAQIRSVTVKLQALTSSEFTVYLQQPYGVRAQYLGRGTTNSILTYTWTKTVQGDGRAWTAADVNSAVVSINAKNGSRFYRLEVDVVYNERPVVTALAVSSSGTPTVTWTYTDPDGDLQERYHVRIFPDYVAAASGFNPDTSPLATYMSGVVLSGVSQHTVTSPLPPGGYVVYVIAADVGSGGRYSLWESTTLAIAGTPPATPALISATTDAVNGRNTIVSRQNDNLIAYNQGSFEITSDGTGWYIDANVSSLATATTSATNVEGSRVLAMTCASTSAAKIRSGGTWATAGLGGSQNLQIRTWQFNARANDNNYASVTIAAASGSTLFAFTTDDVNGEGSITVSSTPSLTWTLVKRQGKTDSGRRDAVTIYRSSSTSATTYTVRTNSSTWVPSIGVAEITGAAANPVGASGGGSTVGAVNASYVSTAAGSWGWLVYADWNAAAIPSPDSSSIRQAGYSSGAPNTSMVLRRTSTTSLSGQTVNLTTTTPTSGVEANYAYVEILPAAAPAGVPSTLLAGIPVTAGGTYTKFAACWVASPANAVRDVRVDVEWYDVTGALLSTTTGTNFSTVAGNLLADQSENVTAPANAVCAVLVPQTVTAPTGGNVYHFDRIGLTYGADSRWFRGGMQVRNLLTCDQGSLQSSSGGWGVAAGQSWTTIDRFAYANVKPGQVLRTYVTAQPHTCSALTGQVLAAEAGITYTGYALALAAAGTPDGWLDLQFEDAPGQVKGTVTGSRVTLGTAAWQLLSVTGTMPAGAVAIRLRVNSYLTATGTGNAVYWTWMGISPGSTVPTAWQPGPTPNTFPLVESSDDGGDTWIQVRGCDSVNFDPANSWQATVHDYEAPSNAARLYRVSTAGLDYGIDPTGFYTVSSPTDSSSLTLPVTDFYLVDPYVPSRTLLQQEGEMDISTPEPQALFAPLGRSTEIITYDRPKGKHVTLNLGLLSGAELDVFETLRESGHVLFLQTPYARSWYVKMGPAQTTKWLISPDVTGRFNVSIELIEVARPS